MATFLKNITLVSQSAALYRDDRLKKAEVSGYQARYILSVYDNEGVSQDKLAKIMLVNKSNVARQVSALEAAGYLTRRQSEEDKRVMCVYTTDKGKEIVPLIREVNASWRKLICEGLSEEDKAELDRILQLLVDNAHRHLEREVYNKGR